MADDPPRVLGFAIPVVAALLILSLTASHFVEYQDAVSVSLTLKAGDSYGRAYGEAYLEPGQAGAVRVDQAVDMELSGQRLRAKVGEITPFDMHTLYRVRVELPPDFVLGSFSGTPHVQARILTEKKVLFDKLFGAFRVLSRNL
jgi:hypothetical protein